MWVTVTITTKSENIFRSIATYELSGASLSDCMRIHGECPGACDCEDPCDDPAGDPPDLSAYDCCKSRDDDAGGAMKFVDENAVRWRMVQYESIK
jgi:hypothetical protein